MDRTVVRMAYCPARGMPPQTTEFQRQVIGTGY